MSKLNKISIEAILSAPQVKADELEFDKEYVLFNSVMRDPQIFEIATKPFKVESRYSTAEWIEIILREPKIHVSKISTKDYNLRTNNYNSHKVVELAQCLDKQRTH